MNDFYDFSVLRALRKRSNITLKELAQISGLTYSTVEAVETNKTLPSLKTLDCLAGAFRIKTSRLIGLTEPRRIQRRKSQREQITSKHFCEQGIDKCRIARFSHGKLIRVTAEAGDLVHVMGLHEDVHEFCYVLSGVVELRIEESCHTLGSDETILFDGFLDHAYRQIKTGEYITLHIPKDLQSLEHLLSPTDDAEQE